MGKQSQVEGAIGTLADDHNLMKMDLVVEVVVESTIPIQKECGSVMRCESIKQR